MLDLFRILSREDFIRTGSSPREKLSLSIRKVLNLMLRNLNSSEIKLSNIALLLDSSVTLNQIDLTLRPKRLMFMKSKLMEDLLRIKLNLEILFSKKKSLLIKFSKTLRLLMFSEPLKVKDSVVLLRDSVVRSYQERLIEV